MIVVKYNIIWFVVLTFWFFSNWLCFFKVIICNDDYKFNSYTLECSSNLAVNITSAVEYFSRKVAGDVPDCTDAFSPYPYSYVKPFINYCNGKDVCSISQAFLDDNRLFEAETYQVPAEFFIIPTRIEITFTCIGK